MAPAEPTSHPRPTGEYTVLARRYRPQQFHELIGQEPIAAALVNALRSGRVAHAYLFTGSRGVGKTSAARILAKALNCVEGPTPTPCDRCDSCLGVAAGDDVDVIEIDGASNNKVDEARDIRQNVGFRPARSRYKIYIIDEVHMLTPGAFNALLKTLEEPPEHVKFILATTEVQKIPITILSRCQRFDFANVGPDKIFEQLKRVVTGEGREADDDALRLIARRAGGSMRDSQSLLDQVLAAGTGKLTVEHVSAVLGTPNDERVSRLAAAILAGDAKTALNLIASWSEQGLQIGEFIDHLIGYWRALLLVNCGGPDLREVPVATPAQREAILALAGKISLDTILAGLDVWTTTRGRLRDIPHAQVLLEMAVVRLCRLGELLSVGQLLHAIQSGSLASTANRPVTAPVPSPTSALTSTPPPSSAPPLAPTRAVFLPPEAAEVAKIQPKNPTTEGVKKNDDTTADEYGATNGPLPPPVSVPEQPTLALTEATLKDVWGRLMRQLKSKYPILAKHLQLAQLYAISGPNSLAIRFSREYTYAYEACLNEANTQRIRETLSLIIGQPAGVRFELVTAAGTSTSLPGGGSAPVTPADHRRQLQNLPMFRRAWELLRAQISHVDEDFDPYALPRKQPEPPPVADPDEI